MLAALFLAEHERQRLLVIDQPELLSMVRFQSLMRNMRTRRFCSAVTLVVYTLASVGVPAGSCFGSPDGCACSHEVQSSGGCHCQQRMVGEGDCCPVSGLKPVAAKSCCRSKETSSCCTSRGPTADCSGQSSLTKHVEAVAPTSQASSACTCGESGRAPGMMANSDPRLMDAPIRIPRSDGNCESTQPLELLLPEFFAAPETPPPKTHVA